MMSGRKLLFFTVPVLLIGIVVYSLSGGETTSFYEKMQKERREKDEMLRTSEESPFQGKTDFQGLHYFEPDASFEVYAKLDEEPGDKTFSVQMTGGQTETYHLYGRASFDLDGKLYSLLVFRSTEAGTLFIPFRDATNQSESYGGGRYLDISEKNVTASHVTIDFNKSYNPYCAYSEEYTCPIPPKENTLPVAIRAGEKRYHD
ncbi:MAG: DUF1684 domain-containing protein [Siphonobacter sp.]